MDSKTDNAVNLEIIEGSVKGQDLNISLLINKPYTFLFKMGSNAMKDEGILKGDVIVCSRDKDPEDNDIIVIAIDGHFILRRFVDGVNPKLVSGNEEFEDIYLQDVSVDDLFGVVTSVIRKNVSCKKNSLPSKRK